MLVGYVVWLPSGNEDPQFSSDIRNPDAKLRVAALAARQFGRIRYDQLRSIGVGKATIDRWRTAGYLHRVLPRVYAVGHAGSSPEAELAAALLYAGPGATLSHATAVWWLGLLRYPPRGKIFLSTPRRVQNRANIVVYGDRELVRIEHRGLPTTTVSRAILDYAATGTPNLLRLVLANADYEDVLDVHELLNLSGQGINGTAALREALDIHLPELALTRSELEILLATFCQIQNIAMPKFNQYIAGHLVDAVWHKQRVVVEVDGWQGHRTPAQLLANHRRDLDLRNAGYVPLRYARRQFDETPGAVAKDLSVHLARELRP